ncbi:MAG: hypothetical protein AB1646_16755 [Thermodesulfobacteriota bacterium]
MNRSLAGMVAIALLLSTFGMAFGQGYYGAPGQGAPYGGYGQGYAMPGYGQAAPGYDPGYQSPGAAAYGSSPYQAPQMGASPYGSPYQAPYPQGAQAYPHGQPQYAQPQYNQPQYGPPAQYPQSAPGNLYTEYPQVPGQPGQEVASPEGAAYFQPGALIQNEIYWDPNYDRIMNGDAGPAVEPQQQAPQPPAATQARAVPPDQRSVKRNQGPKRGQAASNRKQAPKAPSAKQAKPSLPWGTGSQSTSQSAEQNTALRWGQPRGDAAQGTQAREQVRHRAPQPQADAQSAAPARLPWGSN